MPNTHQILISAEGHVIFPWADELEFLIDLGKTLIHRASHVEPVYVGEVPLWFVDLHPLGGLPLGPFRFREEALKAERDFLESDEGIALLLGHSLQQQDIQAQGGRR